MHAKNGIKSRLVLTERGVCDICIAVGKHLF